RRTFQHSRSWSKSRLTRTWRTSCARRRRGWLTRTSRPRVEEAHIIAEDLLRADPASDAHADRLRRALVLLGAPDPDKAVARVRSGEIEQASAEDALSMEDLDLGATVPEVDDSDTLPEVDVFVYPEPETPSVRDRPAVDIPIDVPVLQTTIPDPPITDDGDDTV